MSDLPPSEVGEHSVRRSSWEVAGLPAPPYAREDRLLPRQWLREVREARGLTQWTVTRRVTAYIPECRLSLSRLAHIEGGRLSISNVKACHMEGLREEPDPPTRGAVFSKEGRVTTCACPVRMISREPSMTSRRLGRSTGPKFGIRLMQGLWLRRKASSCAASATRRPGCGSTC